MNVIEGIVSVKRKEYEEYVTSRCQDYVDQNYCVIAINGESGEIAEFEKKYTLRGNPKGDLTRNDLLLEIGDVLFYLTRLAALNGWSLDDVMEANREKLDGRVERGAVIA